MSEEVEPDINTDPKLWRLIGTWPPPYNRLHRSELKSRWPKNMKYTFRDWAIINENFEGKIFDMFVRVWLYTYFRFFRA